MKAFLKKEWMEWWRTGRFMVLLLIFVLFGIMNPAMAVSYTHLRAHETD